MIPHSKPFLQQCRIHSRADVSAAVIQGRTGANRCRFILGSIIDQRSTPSLGVLVLDGIPFPGLPKLLLSATYLVYLHLYNIPHSGYISPDVMVTALTALTSLQFLQLEFQSP